MGEVLIHLEKYNEALGKIDTAINLAKEVQSKEYRDESYRLFSLLYERMGNFDKALQYHKLHTKLNDTIFSREKQNRISEIQIKYETEKKEKEIELLKEAHELKVKRQRTIIISIIIVIAMLLIVVGLIYNQFRLKKKNTKILQEKNDQLEKTNKKLKESEQNLRELNATKDKFFSIISHDLKNPFQALFGFAEAMYNNISQFNTEEIKEYSKAIYESSQNLYNLLENLLQWSRSQLGSIQLSPQKLDINDSLNDIINLLSINAEEKDIDLNNKLAEETTAFVDENVFSTVMRNLLNNSIKFTEKGGKVDIYSRLENSHVVISVSDTGQGISEENMDKLFRIDKNLSTKGTHNEPGTGLGLILCKELIEKSDGKIWVKSKEGKGSVFEFSLPAGTAK
jgi:signal transduction histidine kinase